MWLKMKDLMSKTDTPKSTILYYIKEGLLPEPKKIKSNVHIYDERFIHMIEFIKYLQNNFDASIEQIKRVIKSDGFDFSRGYQNLIDNIDTLMFASKERVYSKSELCRELEIELKELEEFIERGYILDREGGFIKTDLHMAKIVLELKRVEGGEELIDEYVESAKKLSRIETNLALNLLKNSEDINRTSKLLLDTALILKPYIFDSTLFESFEERKREQKK
jgi:DNA-binding transcriptional MerR regulator